MITIGGISVITALIAFMVFLQVEASKNNEYKRAFEQIVIDTNALTQQYQTEEGKWLAKKYDNSTMITIIDQYVPKYQALVDRAEAIDAPERYKEAHGYLMSAIDSEKKSNEHFRNYLATGDQSEYDESSSMLSKSLADSANADAAIKAAG
jgi:hypothetical protein